MTTKTKQARIEVRSTVEDRALIDRAVAVTGTDLTSFVISNLTLAARRVLAGRSHFVLDETQRAAWDEINTRPAQDLPGLVSLMQRPSPFADG